jgi:hypothetical protein
MRAVRFPPTARRASGSQDGTVFLWDMVEVFGI